MATLKDVAKETGLTVSTVSRVLNNRGYISEETRKKVYEAMKKLNYRPNEVARSLSKQTTNTIGVIVPHIRHPYFAELISNLESQAYHHGHKILLFNSQEKNEKEWEYMEMCTSNRVAGVILCSGTVGVEKFTGLNVPLITIERYLENGTAEVECDNEQGGCLAAQLLQVCHKLNIDVPSQMKIVGFDDVNIAALTTPSITTIHQPIREMAKMAVELLVRSGNGELVPNRTTLPVSLVVRETT